MAKAAKGNQNHSKKLRRGKKLEASRPLFVAVEHGASTSNSNPGPTENISLNFTTLQWSY